MRIATWNVNGMRAAVRKGVGTHIEAIDPDVLLLQEVRARPEQLPGEWADPDGYTAYWNPAEKPGYAGTALWTRQEGKLEPVEIEGGDAEGRLLAARVGGVRIVSVYLPSGSSGDHRQQEKDAWMVRFLPVVKSWARSRVPTVLGGDFNIARTERDIYYAKSNEKNSGFLPHERMWMEGVVKMGFADLVRDAYGDVDGPYTWWSNRGRARELDRGWRIDYLLANKAAAKLVHDVRVDREASLTISDHAPVIAELDV